MRKMDDRGETLVESALSISLLGVIGLAVLTAVSMAVMSSTFFKDQADGSRSIRNWAEQVSAYYGPSHPYKNCASSGDWAGYVAPPSGGSLSVKYWDAPSGAFTSSLSSCPASDQGVQLVTLRVVSNASGKSITQLLEVAVRRP